MAYRDPIPSTRRTSGRLDMGACGRQFSSTRAVTPGGPVARPRHNVLATPLPHTLDRRGGSQEGNPNYAEPWPRAMSFIRLLPTGPGEGGAAPSPGPARRRSHILPTRTAP